MSQVPSLVKRRYLLKLAAGMMGSISFLTGAATGGEQQTKHNSISSEQALKLLLDGNQRFVRRKSIHPHQSRERMDSAILSMEIQLVLGGISNSNPSSMKVSR